MRDEWETYARGAAAAADILRAIYGVEVRKALNPLKLKDFEFIVRSLATSLKGHVVPVEDAALKLAMSKLDAKWTDLSPEARAKVIGEAAHYLGPPVAAKVLPKIDQTLAFAAKDIVPTTKQNAVLTYDLKISPDLNATDERIANYVRVSQGHFITNRYGERADAFAGQARGIVAAGLEKGLGSADIAEDLRGALGAETGRGLGYWNTIAMVFANRARTMTQLASYHEAGIESYVWESVLDEATSVQCRFMHGRRFPVAGAMRRFQDVENAESPEDIKTLQPFMSLGREGESQALVFGSGDTRQVVANVVTNAVGRADDEGMYSDIMSDEALAKAGITAPPIHGNCRSTVIPEFGSAGGGHGGGPAPAAPKPVDSPPPKPTAGALKAKALATLDAMPTMTGEALGEQAVDSSALFVKGVDFEPPFLQHPMFAGLDTLDDLGPKWAVNAVSKKPKLDELIATSSTFDKEYTEKLIQKPKALDAAATPKVVKYQGKLYVLDGHEQLAAQKLLGQKTAYCTLLDLDKSLQPVAEAPAVVHDLLNDPHTAVVWGKSASHEGKILNGVPLQPAESGYWENVKSKNLNEPRQPEGKFSTGCVVVEPDGRVWIVEPKDHFGGYEHTFPKGTLPSSKHLSTQQNALKELFEESGLSAEITAHLGDYKGDTGTTRYFIAHRTGGAPWASQGETDTVKLVPVADAQKLLNKARDKKVLEDFVKTLGQPKAPGQPAAPFPAIAPALAPVPPSPIADVILGRKIGGQGGSNPGGLYRGTDGVDRYVKFYSDPLQAHVEQLANSIYRDLGHLAPKSMTFEHEGKLAYASEMMKGVKTLGSLELTPALAQKAMEGFTVDVLTANWDAVGQGLDNMVFTPGGDVARIDNGGCLLLRAQGARKPVGDLNAIPEWDTFFSTKNASYLKVANAAGYNNATDLRSAILPQVNKIVALRDAHGGWAGYVEKMAGAMAPADEQRVVEMLEARTTALQGKVAELRLLASPKEKKFFPKGKNITAPLGVRVKAPPIDHDLVAVRDMKELPTRNIPEGVSTPPGGEDERTYITKWHEVRLSKVERQLEENTEKGERDAIRAFTGTGSDKIRAAQRLTEAEYEKEFRHSAMNYSRAKGLGDKIEAVFGKVPTQPGQVFRGISRLSAESMDKILTSDTLGMLGTASTSRSADVAIRFMGSTYGSENKVLFVLHQHSAIAVEKHSGHTRENELVLSNRARFRVLARHRAEENSNCLIVECEEIEGLVPMPGMKSPKKPSRPRKPKVMKTLRGVDMDVHSAMPRTLPAGWPPHGELGGKVIDLAGALRTMDDSELSQVTVDLPGVGRIRPWRGQDIGFSPDGELLL